MEAPGHIGRAFCMTKRRNGVTRCPRSISSPTISKPRRARLRSALAEVADLAQVEAARVQFLGRSGEITAVRRQIGTLAPAERPSAGKVINDAVAGFEALLDERRGQLERSALEASLRESIDVTYPGTKPTAGSIHPVRRTMDDMLAYFERRGFAVAVGPEIESDYNNFDALNIPPDHPVR